MHPCTQRGFAAPVTFVQIQIAVWVINLTGLLPLPAKSSFHNAQSPVAESAAGCGVVCFLAVQDEILEEVFLIYVYCSEIKSTNISVVLLE